MDFKNCKLGLEDIETKDNGSTTIVGYFASFDNLDSDGDIFQKGAFKKSISENGSRIMHLWQHNPGKPIARPRELTEDTKGLRFVSEISKEQMNVAWVSDAVNLYKSGVLNEHSVGFQTINQKSEDEHNVITEVKLWEGSVVTWGANSETPLETIKNLKTPEIIERLDVVCKALRTGGLTDESYISLERELESIKSLLEPRKHSEPMADELNNLISKYI